MSAIAVHSAPTTQVTGHQTQVSVPPRSAGALLSRVFALLNRVGVPFVVLHGYQTYPYEVAGDVDMMVEPRWLARLPALLAEHRDELGADLVQCIDAGPQFLVLAAQLPDQSPVMLQLHVSSAYELAGRVYYTADEILSGRIQRGSFFIPRPHIEFCCVLLNKLTKQKLTVAHQERLTLLWNQDKAGGDSALRRWFDYREFHLIVAALESGDWRGVHFDLPVLAKHAARRGQRVGATESTRRIRSRVARWVRPNRGLHVVFLGPDGAGKSTIIQKVEHDLHDAFLQHAYLTFAPGLIPGKFAAPKPGGPHSLSPRSLPASLAKAGWWLICYTAGYFATVHPTRARGGLVINHRYLVDAIVDRKRYRYSGPIGLLRAIWFIAPKPDLIILLDAPPEVIHARKREVALEDIIAQRDGYKAIVGSLDYAVVISTDQPIDAAVAQVEGVLLDFCANRLRGGVIDKQEASV